MNKVDLETKIEGLKKAIAEHEEMSQAHKDSLIETEKQLKDLGKIALPPIVLDDIHEAIEKGVSEFDFSDDENYDKEFGIDYDGRVTLESFDINNSQELVDVICEKVNKLFTEADCPEELDTTEADNHAQTNI